jgi:hypothetical protein
VPAVSSKLLISAALMASRPLWSPLFGPSPPKWKTPSLGQVGQRPVEIALGERLVGVADNGDVGMLSDGGPPCRVDHPPTTARR